MATGLPAKTASTGQIVTLMTGRDIEFPFPPRTQPAGGARTEVLRVEGLVASRRVRGRVVLGSRRRDRRHRGAGRVWSIRASRDGVRRAAAHGRNCDVSRQAPSARCTAPRRRHRHGSGARGTQEPGAVHARVDRHEHDSRLAVALLPIQLPQPQTRACRRATSWCGSLDVRPNDARRRVVTLSGGNQQKVVVGRWLLHGCRLLLLDEPTRGVDVGARAELYAIVRQLADSGVAVLLVSSEVPEVLGLADRVLVLRDGRIVHESPAAGTRRIRGSRPRDGRKCCVTEQSFPPVEEQARVEEAGGAARRSRAAELGAGSARSATSASSAS